MGFYGLAFLPTQPAFYDTFLNDNDGGGYDLRIATCLRIVVWGEYGHAPCKISSLQQILFLCQLNFMEIIRLPQSRGRPGHP